MNPSDSHLHLTLLDSTKLCPESVGLMLPGQSKGLVRSEESQISCLSTFIAFQPLHHRQQHLECWVFELHHSLTNDPELLAQGLSSSWPVTVRLRTKLTSSSTANVICYYYYFYCLLFLLYYDYSYVFNSTNKNTWYFWTACCVTSSPERYTRTI